ncbi:PAC2 family protein [Rhabdothermincola salaria]|uniref:PAC2 family protein n=1 Tax=Rhabdothermincola salaria TaxID=2903142 RepID=UPI001E331C91|nr:PAC2 family protein [Rhabdothermincola salaria]MCD9624744.1 PAC2 family protein [Rhabdothermincola salaria]
MAGDPGGHPRHVEHLLWTDRPALREPVLVVAFGGWSDAGDAASTAVEFLADQWSTRSFASIDPEVFYDFTSSRPMVRFDEHGARQIDWPENVFSAGTVPGADLDVITLSGVEPQLRWRTFCDHVIAVAEAYGARMVVTLGALLADVPHSRPVSVFGTAYDDDLVTELDLVPSRYEGPTGMTGVLHTACHEAGLRSAGLWAAVPAYVPSAPSPKAAMALVERTAQLLQVGVTTTELQLATAAYERQVSELVDEDVETIEYVAQLEERYDSEPDAINDGVSLVDEVERFLRDQD